MDIKNEIIEKTNNWKEAVIKYNDAVYKATQLYLPYEEATEENIKEKINKKLIVIEKKDKKVNKTYKELLEEIIKISDYQLRKTLVQLLTTTADFAGLDEKSLMYLQNPEISQEMLQTCVDLHDISISHQVMVAEKLIDFVQTQTEITGESY